MANIYVRSSDGSDADNGSTWALAKATAAGAAAIDAAGDSVYFSSAHSESAASVSCAWAAVGAPVLIASVSDAAEPPTTLAAGAAITVTGTTFAWTGQTHTYGIRFTFSSASSWAPGFAQTSGVAQTFELCDFWMTGAGGSSSIRFGSVNSASSTRARLTSCTFRFGAAGQNILINQRVNLSSCSLASGGTSPATLFGIGNDGRSAYLYSEGLDLTNASAGINLCTFGMGGCEAVFVNTRVPASWSGALVVSGGTRVGSVARAINIDSGDTNYRFIEQRHEGISREETTIVMSGGSQAWGTTGTSLRMASNGNAAYPHAPFEGPKISIPVTSVGASKSITIEIVNDGVTLTDADLWAEAQYLGTSGVPLGAVVTTRRGLLASAANLTTSSVTWTTTGLSSPTKQKITLTFTPQEIGEVAMTLYLARANTTIYANFPSEAT